MHCFELQMLCSPWSVRGDRYLGVIVHLRAASSQTLTACSCPELPKLLTFERSLSVQSPQYYRAIASKCVYVGGATAGADGTCSASGLNAMYWSDCNIEKCLVLDVADRLYLCHPCFKTWDCGLKCRATIKDLWGQTYEIRSFHYD